MEAVAHTLAYDGRIVRDFMTGRPLPGDRWSGVEVPTLVMHGELSEPFFATAAGALGDLLPNATHRSIPRQGHGVAPEAVAPTLIDFLRN